MRLLLTEKVNLITDLYEIYQAPRLIYFLSVSIQQDTLSKLARHRIVHFSPVEFLIFILYQPILDFAYTVGVAQGLWLLTHSSQKREIG